MSEIDELRRKAEQFGRLSRQVLDAPTRQLLAELAEAFELETHRLKSASQWQPEHAVTPFTQQI